MRRIAAVTAAFLAAAVAAPTAHGVTFSGQSYASGGSPTSVAVGNFDADSRLDLAAANDYSNTVGILHGNGNGSFGAPATIAVSSTPYGIAAGDFNGDSRPDLATANLDSDNVSILLANGSGGFGAPASFAAGSGPISVAVGHFNADSHRDLAVANYRSFGNVSILLGNGSGGFGAPTNFNTGNQPYAVAVGNFNGDPHADLAVANITTPYNVSVLLGDGTGAFSGPTNFPAGTAPSGVAVGDFNGDSPPDLAVANVGASGPSPGPSNVSILLGNGGGGFGGPTNFTASAGSNAVAVGDFNGDARQDLAVANYYVNTVSVLAGNGSGGFLAPAHFPVAQGPVSVAVGDFDADGRPDIAVANRDSLNSKDVTVLLNTTTNAYPRPASARKFYAALVPAYQQCTSPNRTHGPPLASGSCDPPAQSSANLTAGTSSTAFISLRSLAGAPGGADDTDAAIAVSITDVRCQAGVVTCVPANDAGGDDYAGEVQAKVDVRITDRYSGVTAAGGTEAATLEWALEATVPCAATPADGSAGSACALATTADALYGDPSAAKEGVRAVWQLGRASLYDGGPDGDVETPAGASLFATQGVFAP